ncbi:STAS/SEC14 domain-containing protein [Shewanella sp. NIFS-20-20]|uniref:STAS/SEC14 domain-containing protein n=1 Tax=Shewanella sp. NIFS-20-20 TaxID=2853806 RepID=UPI001C44F467|nr:STAS/SEC14 domain-containing protein [Shewanella sp. NIFS-20-20]MBV7315296.1 STAS/SEC14 domain-containing protein [Shewanella sp. NIFS-20-20]
MLCQIPDVTPGVLSLFVSGHISAEDYRQRLQPLMRQYQQQYGRIDLYIEADVLLEGWDKSTLSGAGEVQFAPFDTLVMLGGPDWVSNALQLFGPLIQGQVAWYPLNLKEDALHFLAQRQDSLQVQ